MISARPGDRPLPWASIDSLLVRLATAKAPLKISQVRRDWIADHHSDAYRFDVTMEVLLSLGIVSSEDDDRIGVDLVLPMADAEERRSLLVQYLLKWLNQSPFKPAFAEAVQCVDSPILQLVLDTHRLPLQLNWFRHLLRELGIFSRSDNPRFWNASNEVQTPILTIIRSSAGRRAPRRKVSKEELQLALSLREERATEAEDWVVKREHQRLAGHPLVGLVKRISDDDISAGYDVESFSSPRVLTFDRHIEVKSFKGTSARFFWSRNEMEVAKSFGESYVLVLVNIDRIADPDYVPHEITDPYHALSQSTDWIQFPAAIEFRQKPS